eukprot:1137031-Pelagomonas_calceolata.AAC.5
MNHTLSDHPVLHRELFCSPVEEQVHHHVPWGGRRHHATHLQHHAGQQVVQHGDGVLPLVVGGDGNVHVVHGRVGVAEADGGDVHIGCLLDGLVVSPESKGMRVTVP